MEGDDSMLTAAEKQKLKRMLLDEQSRLIQKVQNEFLTETSYMEASGDLSHYDNHPADSGTEMYEREKDLTIHDHAERKLEKINEALHAIEDGTYGICRVCSMDIPYKRLLAFPTADTCIEHADEAEEMRSSPKNEREERTAITDEGEEVGYDREDAWQDVSKYGTSDTPSDFTEDKASYDDMFINSEEDIGVVEGVERFGRYDRETNAFIEKE